MPLARPTLVIPLKPSARAKSRLELPGTVRAALAGAFASDLIGACAPINARVVVVGGRPPAGRADWLPDPGGGLNAALTSALRHLEPRAVVVAVMGDLPCVRADDLDALLREAADAGSRGVYVSDAAGTGTTCLAARAACFRPAFGPRSRARHAAAGHVELDGTNWTRLRRDVDCAVDLFDAVRIGVGPATQEALRRLAWGQPN